MQCCYWHHVDATKKRAKNPIAGRSVVGRMVPSRNISSLSSKVQICGENFEGKLDFGLEVPRQMESALLPPALKGPGLMFFKSLIIFQVTH